MTSFAPCTTIAHHYLPPAQVLAESFRLHHPEAAFATIVVDRPIKTRFVLNEHFGVLPITDIDLDEDGFAATATAYDERVPQVLGVGAL